MALGKVDLVGNAAAVHLDFHKVRFLLFEAGLADLGVGEDANDRAVLLNAFKLAGSVGALALGVLFGILGESLLLAAVPALVESRREAGVRFSPQPGIDEIKG